MISILAAQQTNKKQATFFEQDIHKIQVGLSNEWIEHSRTMNGSVPALVGADKRFGVKYFS